MGATRLLRVITPGHPSAGPYGSGRSGANCAATEAARYSRSHGQPRLGPQCGGQVTGGGVGVVTNGVGVVMGGVGVVTGGGGLVTGDGGGVVTGDGGVLVTGSGGGVLCSAGGGAVVADSPGSGAVVAGGTAAGAVGDGDGWDASAGPCRNGPGFRRGSAGRGRCTASLAAGSGSLGLAASSLRRRYAGPQRRDDTQWPARAVGQPANGRRRGDGDGGAGAGLHRPRRCGLPQPQRHARRRHRHRRGRGQQPWRQQPPEPVPAGPPDAGPAPAGPPDAGPARAGRDRRGGEPVAERIRLAGRPPAAGIGIGRGHGRRGPERHGSPSSPRRARPPASPSWWQSVRPVRRTVTVTHRQMTPSCARATHARMPPMRGKARRKIARKYP